MHHQSSAFAALLLVLISWPAAPETTSPAEKLIGHLQGIQTIEAEFNQLSRGQAQAGRLTLQKPNRFVLENDPPLSQTVVSDGSSLWTFDRDLDQVIASDLDESSEDIPILLITAEPDRIETLYQVEDLSQLSADEPGIDTFLLTPRQSNTLLDSVLLKVGAGGIQEIAFNTMSGERTLIRFEQTCLNCEIPEDRFSFQVPEGVDFIDDRSVPN